MSALSELSLRMEALHLAVNGDLAVRRALIRRIVDIMDEREEDAFLSSTAFSEAVIAAHSGRPFVIRQTGTGPDGFRTWEVIAP